MFKTQWGTQVLYEVLGYPSQQAYDNVRYVMVEKNLTRKRDALKIGRKALKKYPIVKVQSNDSEFLEVTFTKNLIIDREFQV